MKEKERRKTKSEENERRRREKAAVAFLVFIIATMEIFGRKILFWQNTLLAVTLSQNLARYATFFFFFFFFYRYSTNDIQIETYKHYKICNNYLN